MPDIRLIHHRGRFYIKAETDDGRRWVRRVVASDTDSVSVEFLADYERLIGEEGLSYEIVGREK